MTTTPTTLCRRPRSWHPVSTSGPGHATHAVLTPHGDLDVASGDACFEACIAAPATNVTVDLGHTTFMDCSGYAAIAAARLVVEARGGTLIWGGACGEPAHLLRLMAASGRVATTHGSPPAVRRPRHRPAPGALAG